MNDLDVMYATWHDTIDRVSLDWHSVAVSMDIITNYGLIDTVQVPVADVTSEVSVTTENALDALEITGG